MMELVAFDIETTGFAVGDTLTVVGFAVPLGVRVFCQTDGVDAAPIETAIQESVETHVRVSTHASEGDVLAAVREYAAERLIGEDVLLVAYNGETWRGGFDLPFLRSRLAAADIAWPFTDVPYADVFPVIRDQFNTTVGDEEGGADLVTAYETLCTGTAGELDPFDDSAAAVEAFETGAYADLVRHNVVDVLRTRALGRLAQRYCSKSDFQVKSLTPVVSDHA
jgi:uncharacterized protein YprB with RNaseH-like and TPR domain